MQKKWCCGLVVASVVAVEKRWLKEVDTTCPVCNTAKEDISHLFAECQYSVNIRSKVFKFLKDGYNVSSFEDQVQEMIKLSRKKTVKAKLILACWTEFIYAIWRQKNRLVFDKSILDSNVVSRNILFSVACRASETGREILISEPTATFG